MIKQTFKTPTQLLCSLIVALMLAACGGGGSGSGALPQKVTITTSNPTSGTLTEDSVIHIALDETTGFEASLSGVDITSLFVNDGSNNKKRKVNVYALQGILSENASSKLTASVKGSRVETLNISYKGKPELVFTKVTGGIAVPSVDESNALLFLKDDDSTPVSSSADCGVDNCYPTALPANAGFSVANGAGSAVGSVRNALLEAISLQMLGNSSAGNITKTDDKSFKITNFSYPIADTEDTASFGIDAKANGVTSSINFAVPGKIVSDMVALQLSNMDEEHVISEWVSGALVNYINILNTEARAIDGEPIYTIANENICLLLSEGYAGINSDNIDYCELNVTSIDADEDSFKTTIDFSSSADNKINGWAVKASVETVKNLVIGTKVIGYLKGDWEIVPGGCNQAERVGYERECEDGVLSERVLKGTEIATAKYTLNNALPEVMISFDLGKPADGSDKDLVAVSVNYECLPDHECYDKPQLGSTTSIHITTALGDLIPGTCSKKPGSACGQAMQRIVNSRFKEEVEIPLNESLAFAAYCLQPLTVNADSTPSNFDPADVSGCRYEMENGIAVINKPWDKVGEKHDSPVFLDLEETTVVSAKEKQLTDSRFISTQGENAAFVSFSGYEKTRDDGVHINALGAHYVLPVSGEVEAGKLPKVIGTDAVVAVSSNWINQRLLAMYQSKQLDKEEISTVGKLGLLGMLGSIPGIKSTDPIKVNIKSTSAPHINFVKDGNDEYIELVVNGLNAVIVLQKDISTSCTRFKPIGGCELLSSAGHPFIDVTLDVKARLSPNAFIAGADKLLAIDNIMFYITKAVGTKVTVSEGLGIEGFDPTAKNLQSMMYPVIRDELIEALTWKKPIDFPSPFCEGANVLFNALLQSFIGVAVDDTKVFDFYAVSAELGEALNGKSEHVLLGTKLVDGDNAAVVDGLHIAQLILENKGSCTK